MATVIIGQYSYAFVQSGGYDYASSGGVTYYYRQTGTTQWLEYTQAQSGGTTTQTQSGYTTTQASSSSGGTVPAQYSNRLVSNVYEGQMGGINIRWGPVAIQRLQDNTSAKGISLYTMKALCEHFVYLMARRLVNQGINISTATIKSAPHDFTENTATHVTTADDEHITAELTGKRKAHVYLSGVGSGATAYDNVSMRGESIMTRQGGASPAIITSLSIGHYPSAGTSAAQAPAATTTAASGYTTTTGGYNTTATAGGYSWEDDPQYPGYERRWNVQTQQYDRRPSTT